MLREPAEGKEPSLVKRLVNLLKGNRKLEIALYGGVILAVLLLYAGGFSKSDERTKTQSAQETASGAQELTLSEAALEQKLASVLSCIRGAGRVEVMVTYETGAEIITAMSTNTNSDSSETREDGRSSSSTQTTESTEPATVAGSDGDEPIVLLERQPVVRGVIVVAEGAADVRVKLDLQRAVQAVLNIPLAKIEVFERAGTGIE